LQQLATLIKERDDLVQAINKLRGGISSLNREAASACLMRLARSMKIRRAVHHIVWRRQGGIAVD
jgi:hypothetical protein